MEQKTLYMTLSVVFVLALVAAFVWGRTFLKKLGPDTARRLNWAGFVVAIFGGSAWYVVKHPAFMFATLSGVIMYFLFYDYDKKTA